MNTCAQATEVVESLIDSAHSLEQLTGEELELIAGGQAVINSF